MTKRILVVSQRYWPENVKINEICEGLAQRDCRVDVLCGQPNYPSGKFFEGYHSWGNREEKHGSVRVFRTAEIKRDTGTGARIMMNYLTFPIAARMRLSSLKGIKYDAVLVYQRSPVWMTGPGLRIGKMLGVPVTTYAIDIWPQHFYKEMDIQNILLKKIFESSADRCYQAADRIITQSSEAQNYFTGTLHIHPNRVFCVPPGPDGCFETENKDFFIMEKYAGSFNIVITDETLDRQDYSLLFESSRMLLNAGISDLRFIILGNGRNAASLKKKADSAGLHDMIFFEVADSPEKQAEYYYVADAFLDCQKVDAAPEMEFPVGLINCMAVGKPVLSTTGSLEKRIIRDAGCGFVCEPKDPQGLFDMIIKLYKSPIESIRFMGQSAREYQKEHFDREKGIDRILEIMLRKNSNKEDEFIINQKVNIIKTED